MRVCQNSVHCDLRLEWVKCLLLWEEEALVLDFLELLTMADLDT